MERAWADAYIFIRFRSARRLAGARRAGGVCERRARRQGGGQYGMADGKAARRTGVSKK